MTAATIARDVRLDALRVISAFAVVWLHVAAAVVRVSPDLHSSAWWVANIADAAVRWCIPIFVMISGALLLAYPSESKPFEFYRRRAARLLPPLVFWTLFYLGFRAYRTRLIDLEWAVTMVARGVPFYHLWYLYMIAGLALVTPFIRQFVSAASPHVIRLCVILSLAIASLDATANAFLGREPATFLGLFPPFLGYFVAGYYLRSIADRTSVSTRHALGAVTICTVLIATAAGLPFSPSGPRGWLYLYGNVYSYLNPLVIVSSLYIYHAALARRISESPGESWTLATIQRMAPLTLGIYVIHPFWLFVLQGHGIDGFLLHPLFGIPATTALTFGLSALSAAVLSSIPLVRSTVA